MRDKSAFGTDSGAVKVSEATSTPWLNILLRCLLISGTAAILMAIIAFFFSGVAGSGSVLAGAILVIAFFGLSLLVGHLYGSKNPSGALGVFMVTYLVKVVGFAVLLFALGQPDWLDAQWFAMSGVVAVLTWQATEVVVFSRQRLQLYNDPAPAEVADKVNKSK